MFDRQTVGVFRHGKEQSRRIVLCRQSHFYPIKVLLFVPESSNFSLALRCSGHSGGELSVLRLLIVLQRGHLSDKKLNLSASANFRLHCEHLITVFTFVIFASLFQ